MANNSNDIFMKTLGIGGPFAIGGGIAALGKNVGSRNARIAAQKAIANGITNPANFPQSLPYNATRGINMSGGIPYGAIQNAKFFNASGGLGTGMYSPGIPMGAGRLPVAGPGIPMGPGPLPTYGPAIPMGGGQAARGGLLSIPQGGPGNALLAETNTLAVPRGYGYGTVLADGGTLRLNGSNLASGSNLINEVPVTIRSGVPGGGGGGGIPLMPAGALEAGATEASVASKGAGLLARLGYAPSGVGRFGAFIRPGLTGGQALGVLGGGLTAGTLAGAGVGALNLGGKESAVDRFSTGAAFGAPIGAAIGNVIPFPVVGAGIGALAGGAIGGVGNVVRGIFEDNDKADMTRSNQKRMNNIDSLFETAGLTPNQMAQYRAQFDTGMAILGDKPKPSDVATLLTQLETQVQKTAGTNAGKLTSKDMVALQAAIGQYMQPIIQQQQASGDVAAQLYNDMAGNMGSSAMANLVRGQAAGYKAQADALSAAYMGAAQNVPALYGLQQMGQLANQQQSTQSANLMAQLQAAQQ